jgi:hypothetical protein
VVFDTIEIASPPETFLRVPCGLDIAAPPSGSQDQLPLSDMPQDERGYLILPHELATGADRDGCLTVVERGGDMVEFKCGPCGACLG